MDLNESLFQAAKDGNFASVQTAINKGTDINIKDKDGMTALIYSSANGHADVVNLLLSKNAEINAKSNDGWTALMIASYGGHTNIVNLLISHNADISIKNNNGYTALMGASEGGHANIADLLVTKGADVNSKMNNGFTPLIWASYKGYKDVVNLLISKGADINAKDNEGNTALIDASYGNADVVNILISKGADINARNNSGINALKVATAEGHTDIVNILRANGAEVNISTSTKSVNAKTKDTSKKVCKYHPNEKVIGVCKCGQAVCETCGTQIIELNGKIAYKCIDCTALDAKKKIKYSYVLAGVGFFVGIANIDGQKSLGYFAPILFAYAFWAIYVGWLYGGKRLLKVYSYILNIDPGNWFGIIFFYLTKFYVSIFGGGISQFLFYKNILKLQTNLNTGISATNQDINKGR